MKNVCLAAVALLACVTTSSASVRISEVVYNEVGSSFLGEWIEIYNAGNVAVDLSNYKIGDEETQGGTGNTEALFQFPAGSTIAPGQVQIIASGAVRFAEVYSFAPTYEFAFAGDGSTAASDDPAVPNLTVYTPWDADGDRLNMSNSNDQVVLVDGADQIVDTVGWGNTFAFSPGLAASVADGRSYERVNARIDTDTAADWQLGNLSSPGLVVVPEPTSALVVGSALLMTRRRR